MCQDNCADYANCTEVLYVHYEGDFGSPLGYWDCWWGKLDVANVACGGSARGGDGPGGLADAETQASVGVISSGEVPDSSSGDGSSGTVSDLDAGTSDQMMAAPSADASLEGVQVLGAGQVTDVQKRRAAAAAAARKRLGRRRLLAKRQAINMSPSPNVGVREEDYQVLMHRAEGAVSSSAYGLSSASPSPVLRHSTSSSPALVSTPHAFSSGTSIVQTPSPRTLLTPVVNTPSTPDVVTPPVLPFSIASVGFRSSSDAVLTPLAPLTPLTPLVPPAPQSNLVDSSSTSSSSTSSPTSADDTAPSSPVSDVQTPSLFFVPNYMPDDTIVATPSIAAALTPTPPTEPSPSDTLTFSADDTAATTTTTSSTNSLRSDPRPSLTASNDDNDYYTSLSSSLSAAISSSLNSELHASIISAFSIPESAYSAARSAVTAALAPPPLFNPVAPRSSSSRNSSSSSSSSSSSMSPSASPSVETSSAPAGYTFADSALPLSSSSSAGGSALRVGSASASAAVSTLGSSTDDGLTTETLYWGNSASKSASACTPLATATVTVTRIVGPSAPMTPLRTPPVGTPGVF